MFADSGHIGLPSICGKTANVIFTYCTAYPDLDVVVWPHLALVHNQLLKPVDKRPIEDDRLAIFAGDVAARVQMPHGIMGHSLEVPITHNCYVRQYPAEIQMRGTLTVRFRYGPPWCRIIKSAGTSKMTE
jgi:hypothetical protein